MHELLHWVACCAALSVAAEFASPGALAAALGGMLCCTSVAAGASLCFSYYDPYMRSRMTRVEGPNVFTSYTPGSVGSLSLSLCFLLREICNLTWYQSKRSCL